MIFPEVMLKFISANTSKSWKGGFGEGWRKLVRWTKYVLSSLMENRSYMKVK